MIHGVVGAAHMRDWEVVGFKDGFEGLLPPGDFKMLTRTNCNGIVKLGGTILGTTNKGNFAAKVGTDDVKKIAQDIVEKTKQTLKRLEIEGLIVVGGDGSLTTANFLADQGIPLVGVPKTIDNDLDATVTTFGFDSAISTVVDALDRLHTTASSHKRIMVVEVMGRNAGWIALYGGLAGDADVILLPEIPFNFGHVADFINRRDARGDHSSIVVVAEGTKLPNGNQVIQGEGTTEKQQRFGGIGDIVAEKLSELTGKETRACRLGHLQRGGSPTALDRILGTRFGVHAVQLIEQERYGRMVSYASYRVDSVPIKDAIGGLKLVDPGGEVVDTAKRVGIHFGDEAVV